MTERGANLSMGQRRLIGSARALIAGAPIQGLDGATSSIYSAARIRGAPTRMLAGHTGLVIAHR